MSTQIALLIVIFFGISLLPSTPAVLAQDKQDEIIRSRVKAFLETSEELRNYARVGYTSSFSGEFRPIPEALEVELARNLPEYKFYIPRMAVMIDPPSKKYDLIVITNAVTGEVKSFVWGHYWMIRPSASFELILRGHQARSEEDALNRVKTLAKLISYTNNDEVGKTVSEKGKLKVELLRGEGVFHILEIKIDKHLRLGRLSITGPDGKKPRYFVRGHYVTPASAK
jgi:hypothetical protein